MDKGIIRQVSLTTAACFYCDWLDWLRIIILANISIEKVRHFILSWSGPGVKSRTLTWNTEGSFTPSALFGWRFLSVCVLDGVLEHCKSVISFFHSLLCQPLENFWGTYLNHCVNIHLYMKKCTKTSCLNISCERRLHFRGMSWRAKSS